MRPFRSTLVWALWRSCQRATIVLIDQSQKAITQAAGYLSADLLSLLTIPSPFTAP